MKMGKVGAVLAGLILPAVLLANKCCAFLCCKPTKLDTAATRIGKAAATALALVIPYYYAVLAAVGRLSLPGGAEWALLAAFVPLCAALTWLLNRFLPVLYLTKRRDFHDGT